VDCAVAAGHAVDDVDGVQLVGGVVLLALGAVVCVVAYRIMLRIGRLPEERRVLR
jgi:tight adherence protein B